MSSDLKVTNIKHASSGSNNLVLASDGNVSITNTLSAGTIGGGVSMASSGVTVRNITQVPLSADIEISGDTANSLQTWFSPTYTPLFSGSKVQAILTYIGYARVYQTYNGRKIFRIEFTGSGITDQTMASGISDENWGVYDYGGSGSIVYYYTSLAGPLLTTTTTATITANCKVSNPDSSITHSIVFKGNNSTSETFMNWIEYK